MIMTIEQQVATFPIPDGELELWQPESCERYWPPTDYTARFTVPPETCPWKDEMVQELWSTMLQEGSEEMDQLEQETIGWEELDKLARGPVDTAPHIDIDEPSYFTEILMVERGTLGP